MKVCNTYERPIFDTTIELKDNAMLKVRPELFEEWDFEKNNELGLDIYKVTKASIKVKPWWICRKCKSSYDTNIHNRVKGTKCPYCSGQKVNDTNSLASISPELASEWHPTKNGKLTPYDVTCGRNIKVWWLGDCGHEWEATIASRNNIKCGCPYCSNKKVSIDNCMWTTNPKLASMLANSDDGYKYTQSSGMKVDWRCPDCGEVIKNKVISNVSHRGVPCPRCSDGVSYPEKFIKNMIYQLNIENIHQKLFEWSNDKVYDFYLPFYNMIIEVHGLQHYNGGFEAFGGRTLVEEQENDRLKEKLAKDNGIEHYIIIDARYSDIDYMITSIHKSGLFSIFDIKKVDWSKCHLYASTSLMKLACEYFNSGKYNSVFKIAHKMNISNDTVRKYLKQSTKIGLCSYDPKKAAQIARHNTSQTKSKRVVQLSMNGCFIKEWASGREACRGIGIYHSHSSISACCTGKQKYAYGYIWMFKEDYERYIVQGNKIKVINIKKVVMLSRDGHFINIYNNTVEAGKDNNIKSNSHISACCRGKRKTAGGYKWMYKEDYEKYIEEQKQLA